MVYAVELRRKGKLRQGWIGVTHYQVTDIEPDSAIVEDEVESSGKRVELCFGDGRSSVSVKMPDDGDSLWFMDPATGAHVRSIKYSNEPNTQKTFRTGEREVTSHG